MTSCCSISDSENESNTMSRLEEGSPTEDILWKHPSLAWEDGEEEEESGRTGGCREVTGILPYPGTNQDGGGGRALKDQQRLATLGPQQGKVPHKKFFKGGLKRPWR